MITYSSNIERLAGIGIIMTSTWSMMPSVPIGTTAMHQSRRSDIRV